jgi:hypothetical protein
VNEREKKGYIFSNVEEIFFLRNWFRRRSSLYIFFLFIHNDKDVHKCGNSNPHLIIIFSQFVQILFFFHILVRHIIKLRKKRQQILFLTIERKSVSVLWSKYSQENLEILRFWVFSLFKINQVLYKDHFISTSSKNKMSMY